jgi:cysteine desulfurase
MRRVYLDHHAAAPLSSAAREAMSRAHEHAWANASSAHAEGRAAKAGLEAARRSIADALGAHAADVVLTAGGTEAANLGVLGLALAPHEARVEDLVVVTSSLEHPAIERAVAELAARGAETHALPLHEAPLATLAELVARPRLRPVRWMLATQAVSHETGTVLDVAALADTLPREARIVVDACQALGKLPTARFVAPGWAVAVSGAKVGASAGSGALLIPRGLDVAPRLVGGQQERGRRAGTPDVAAQAGFGAACTGVSARLEAMPRIASLRDRLEHTLRARGAVVNGGRAERVATVTNVSFAGWRKATLVAALDLEGLAVSAGAACSSGLDGPSPVVRALHPEEPWRAERCVRFSLGPETTDEDIDLALAALDRVLARAPS